MTADDSAVFFWSFVGQIFIQKRFIILTYKGVSMNNYPYYQPPAMRLAQLEQQYQQSQPQTIQNLQGIQPQVQCFFVSNPNDLVNYNIMPGTVYIGINKSSNEIYIRQWNMDGNIEFETYKKESATEQMPEIRAIMAKLEAIEEKIKGQGNESITAISTAGNVGVVSGNAYDATV